jgi:E3 ubiquitin-protein ligase UBR1
MSTFSSIFPNIRRPQSSAIQPQPDQLSELRFALEVMPGSRKFVFTPGARAEILAKLYSSFLGNYPQLFVSDSVGRVPQQLLLSEYQASAPSSPGVGAGLGPGTGKEIEDPVVAGRPCTHIFKKGECCFRCKFVLLLQ